MTNPTVQQRIPNFAQYYSQRIIIWHNKKSRGGVGSLTALIWPRGVRSSPTISHSPNRREAKKKRVMGVLEEYTTISQIRGVFVFPGNFWRPQKDQPNLPAGVLVLLDTSTVIAQAWSQVDLFLPPKHTIPHI